MIAWFLILCTLWPFCRPHNLSLKARHVIYDSGYRVCQLFCGNRIPHQGGLNNRHLFLTVLEAESPGLRFGQIHFQVRALSWVCRRPPPRRPRVAETQRALVCPCGMTLALSGQGPSLGLHLILIPYSRPSQWEVRASTENWREMHFSPQHWQRAFFLVNVHFCQ